ncbi:MAG: YqgE/AlgH family protein [Alphaproteobacteria bacterium]|nr:YqgE/AlgH family protein [Alphaproteobacteria bacterium]
MIRDFTQGNTKTGSLAGHLLVATSGIDGGCFDHSVIYICSHNSEGAMGLIINAPLENVPMQEVFEQLSITPKPLARSLPMHFGGPVENGRGFVIHSDDFVSPDPLISRDGITVTANAAVLYALAEGKGPQKGLLTLGYAGWSPGQLETEIESGSWVLTPATSAIIFEAENDMKWNLAIASLGFDMGHFSTIVGHA